MEIKDIISKKVSFQLNAWSNIDSEVLIEEVIKDIKRGKYAVEVNKLRFFLNNNEKEKYDIYKKRLPGVTFCANFNGNRKRELIKNYHRLIVIDIDKLEKDELIKIREILKNDDFVFTFWISPSDKGIKGLIYLEYQFELEEFGIDFSHKYAFQLLTDYFKNKYSILLDISGSDTTRLCFVSFDPNLLFKPKIVPFNISEPNIIQNDNKVVTGHKKKELKTQYLSTKDVLNNPDGKNIQKNKKTMVNIIKYLKKRNISITSTYEDWYRVAYAIANSFTHNIGEIYFLSLCELDGAKHDDIESRNMLLYCYHNNRRNINFSTITFLAKSNGFEI